MRLLQAFVLHYDFLSDHQSERYKSNDKPITE